MNDPQFDALTTEPERLAYIHDDMQSWVYEDAVGMNECSAVYFITWYRWRVQNFPVEHITDSGRVLHLQDFNIESVVSIMADGSKNRSASNTNPQPLQKNEPSTTASKSPSQIHMHHALTARPQGRV